MSKVVVNGSVLGNALQSLLGAQDISPGDELSYQLCKTIWLYHPIGGKIVEAPIKLAQSQKREISVPSSPEERVVEAFAKEWEAIGADKHIANVAVQARVYGLASITMVTKDIPTERPIADKDLATTKLSFNVFDPLNTSGSLVLNQNPNDIDFQHVTTIVVQGKTYHRSRTCVLMNEAPVYIAYTTSAFGYVGRSAYQRALFPLKSFLNTMITDDMVARKAGVLVAKMKAPGSNINQAMVRMFGIKRNVVKEAETSNVIGITPEENIESLNLQNLDGAASMARKDIIENIATSVPMPAKLLLQESFAEGFGEGTEDAKYIAGYIDGVRIWMNPLYTYFDRIVQYRAWNAEFYKTIQQDFPEQYGKVGYIQAFYDWSNSFAAKWPSLITEPDSEKIKVEDVKLKAAIAVLEVLLPMLDPENKAAAVAWLQDNLNALKMLYPNPLTIDFDALKAYTPPQPAAQEEEPKPGKPFASNDSTKAMDSAIEVLLKDNSRGAEKRRNQHIEKLAS